MEERRRAGEVSPYELVLSFDGRDPRQARVAALIHAFDVWSQVELRDRGQLHPLVSTLPPAAGSHAAQTTMDPLIPSESSGHRGLELTTSAGPVFTGYSLFVHVVRRLPLLWPLALVTWIPGMASLGRACYPNVRTGLPPTGGKTTRCPGGDERDPGQQALPKNGAAS